MQRVMKLIVELQGPWTEQHKTVHKSKHMKWKKSRKYFTFLESEGVTPKKNAMDVKSDRMPYVEITITIPSGTTSVKDSVIRKTNGSKTFSNEMGTLIALSLIKERWDLVSFRYVDVNIDTSARTFNLPHSGIQWWILQCGHQLVWFRCINYIIHVPFGCDWSHLCISTNHTLLSKWIGLFLVHDDNNKAIFVRQTLTIYHFLENYYRKVCKVSSWSNFSAMLICWMYEFLMAICLQNMYSRTWQQVLVFFIWLVWL